MPQVRTIDRWRLPGAIVWLAVSLLTLALPPHGGWPDVFCLFVVAVNAYNVGAAIRGVRS